MTDGQVIPGPELPLRIMDHCLLRVNATHIFMAGGRTESYRQLNNAYLLDTNSGAWRRLPDMRQKRFDHACAKLPGHEDKILVVGGPKGTRERSEVLDLVSLEWGEGPKDLDKTFGFKLHLVPYGNTLLLVDMGRERRNIMKMDGNAEEFEEFFQVGKLERSNLLVLPEDYPISCEGQRYVEKEKRSGWERFTSLFS